MAQKGSAFFADRKRTASEAWHPRRPTCCSSPERGRTARPDGDGAQRARGIRRFVIARSERRSNPALDHRAGAGRDGLRPSKRRPATRRRMGRRRAPTGIARAWREVIRSQRKRKRAARRRDTAPPLTGSSKSLEKNEKYAQRRQTSATTATLKSHARNDVQNSCCGATQERRYRFCASLLICGSSSR